MIIIVCVCVCVGGGNVNNGLSGPLCDTSIQTWKQARTHGHCLQKFLRIKEISGLWKIDYSYFGMKLMNCENFFFTIKYLAYV